MRRKKEWIEQRAHDIFVHMFYKWFENKWYIYWCFEIWMHMLDESIFLLINNLHMFRSICSIEIVWNSFQLTINGSNQCWMTTLLYFFLFFSFCWKERNFICIVYRKHNLPFNMVNYPKNVLLISSKWNFKKMQ